MVDGSKGDALYTDEEAEVPRVISGQLSAPEPQPAEDLEGPMHCLKGSVWVLSALDLQWTHCCPSRRWFPQLQEDVTVVLVATVRTKTLSLEHVPRMENDQWGP